MPTDKPRLPREDYARLVAGPGANQHMPIFATEVAELDRNHAKLSTVVRSILELAVTAAALSVIVLLIWIAVS